MAAGQDGRVTRTGRGCIDLRGGRESIRGWGDRQVRVAEQIYWIQGGCKSGRISVTKERCAYWRTRESGLKSEGGRERRIEGGGRMMEGHVKHGDRG